MSLLPDGLSLSAAVAWVAVAAVTLAGAVAVLLARETMRLVAALGTFLIGVAGLYVYYAMPLLGASQVFLYVGGVLVLFLFAIMALRRGEDGRTQLARRFDVVAAATCAGLFSVLVATMGELGAAVSPAPAAGSATAETGTLLLSTYLPHFEAVGGLLLLALVAAVAMGGEVEDR